MGSNQPLRRSPQDKVVAGVLGGFAEHWEVDSKKLRVVYVLATVLSAAFPGVLIYLVLWYVLPWRD